MDLNTTLLQRPGLLVSVRDATEAMAAIEGGADLIDLKQPARGALGAVDREMAREVVCTVGGQLPVSAAAGELVEWDTGFGRTLADVAGIQVLKVGLAACRDCLGWQEIWRDVAAWIVASGKQLAAVVYADWYNCGAPEPDEVFRVGLESGVRFLLVDTFAKGGESLFAYLRFAELQRLLQQAHREGLATVVAGGLSRDSIRQVAAFACDLVGVRGAVCDGGRTGALRTELVRDLSDLLASQRHPSAEAGFA